MYTSAEMAERAGISAARVRQLCLSGKVTARKIGRDWLIEAESAERWISSDARRRYGPREYRERYDDDQPSESEESEESDSKRRRIWPFGD